MITIGTEKTGYNILLITIVTLLFLSTSVTVSATEDQNSSKKIFTLKDALAQAARSNPDILQAEKDIAIALTQLNQSVADQYVPQISVSGSAGYSDSVTSQYRTDITDDGLPDNVSAGISVSKSVFEGFRFSKTTQLRKMNLSLVRSVYADTVDSVMLSVRTSFYKILLLKDALSLAELTDKNLKDYLDFTESSYDLGKATRLEVMQAKAAWNTNRPALIKAQNDYNTEKLNICNLMGTGYNTDIDFSGSLDGLSPLLPVESDREKITSLAISCDATLRSLRNSIETAALNKSIQESAYFPTLSTSFSYKYNLTADPTYPDSRSLQPAWSLGIQLSMGLDDLLPFSGTRNAIREQDETRRKYEVARLARINTVKYEIAQLLNQIDEQKATADAADENAALALEELSIIRAENEQGTYTPLDISDAELAYMKAVYTYKEAVYAWVSLVWQLNSRTGNKETVQ